MGERPRLHRVLLKLSGAAFGSPEAPLDPSRVGYLAGEVAAARAAGVACGAVVGGGNVVRGRRAREFGWPQDAVDGIGMVATVANGLALQQALASREVAASVVGAFEVGEYVARYNPREARARLDGGEVVIFVGGTGRPFLSTDTAAVIRALEIGAEAVLKGSDVAGVYDRDPHDGVAGPRYEEISYDEALGRRLGFMDGAAAALAREYGLPVFVFDLYEAGNLVRITRGENVGTWVR